MKPRVIHRAVVVVAALPLLITSATGSIYSLLLEQGVDAFWLLKIHTGRFGVVNLQPYYSWLLGVLTLLAIGSGVLLLWPRQGVRLKAEDQAAPEDLNQAGLFSLKAIPGFVLQKAPNARSCCSGRRAGAASVWGDCASLQRKLGPEFDILKVGPLIKP